MSDHRKCGYDNSFEFEFCGNAADHWYVDYSEKQLLVIARCKLHQIDTKLRFKEISWDEISIYEVMWT